MLQPLPQSAFVSHCTQLLPSLLQKGRAPVQS